MRKNLKEEAEKFLLENFPKYCILFWSNESAKKCLFLDKDRNVKFEYFYPQFKNKILKNPDWIFSPTKQESKKRRVDTCIRKYGVENPAKLKKNTDKAIETKIKNGKLKVWEGGLTQKALAKKYDVSASLISKKTLANKGIFNKTLLKYKQTNIENLIKNLLIKNNLKFSQNQYWKKFRPDFVIEDFKLVIECDGLLWHSDSKKNKNYRVKKNTYHKEKKDYYKNLGYNSLFFREDEILNKTEIVENIILSKIGQLKKIGGRKCKIQEVSKEVASSFFEKNHLMSLGRGENFALVFESDIVSVIQVVWKNKKKQELEISRFCSKNEYIIQGGFSKLLSFVIKKFSPKKIISFVDERYGDGHSLNKNNFKFISSFVSFKWTDFKQTFHRMKFPGNSGYEFGLAKIWDCGQAKWELELN